jgi:hypothetical protein
MPVMGEVMLLRMHCPLSGTHAHDVPHFSDPAAGVGKRLVTTNP